MSCRYVDNSWVVVNCDGADDADSSADDDSDNSMYESYHSETDCDWHIFQEKDKLYIIGLNVWDQINSHDKTYTQHEVCPFKTDLSPSFEI